jgi:hypothetical protein
MRLSRLTQDCWIGAIRVGSLGQLAAQRLVEPLDRLNPMIEELTSAIEQEGNKRPDVLRLDDIPWCAPTRAIGSGSTGVV